MFKDRQEALEELEQQLLEQEASEVQPPAGEETLVYRNFANHYGQDLRNFASGYQAYAPEEEQPEKLVEEPSNSEERIIRNLMITALLLLAAILGILAWWIFGLAGG